MALIDCAECSKPISTQAKACPHCGARIPKTKLWLWIPLTLFTAFILFALFREQSPEDKEKALARSAINLCWDDQKRKSFDQGVQRFIAGTCEKMESDFIKKFESRP